MSLLKKATTLVADFIFNPLVHLSGKTGEQYLHKGYLYILFNVQDEGIIGKVGETLDLNSRMGQYGITPFKFSTALEYGGGSKEDVKQIIKQAEALLLGKLKACKGFQLIGNKKEYFKVSPEVLNCLEEFFNKLTPVVVKKYTRPELPGFFFPEPVHDLQLKAGQEIYQGILHNYHLINLEARTQSGKTGAVMTTSCFLAQWFFQNKKFVPNIILATAVNQKDWKYQILSRLPRLEDPRFANGLELIKPDKVMILGDLIRYLRTKQTIDGPTFFLLDENQRATQKYQTIDRFLQEVLGLDTDQFGHDPQGFVNFLREKQIYFVFISATDFYNQWLSRLGNYAPYFHNVMLDVGPGYVPWEYYYKNGIEDQVKVWDEKFKNLTTNFINKVEEFLNGNDPNRYIIIRKESRVPIKEVVRGIKEQWGDKIQIVEHHGENRLDSRILTFTPNKPTVLILKDYWRLAQTLEGIENIGCIFDRYLKNPWGQSVDTVLQGLLGRLTGYKTRLNIKIYTNLTVLENFLNEEESVKLDLKTKQTGGSDTRWSEISRENIVIKRGNQDIKQTVLKKLGLKEKAVSVRIMSRSVVRMKKWGLTLKTIDPEFTKEGSVDSLPHTGLTSGGEGKPILWINDSRKDLLKITKLTYQVKEVGETVGIKPGVLAPGMEKKT